MSPTISPRQERSICLLIVFALIIVLVTGIAGLGLILLARPWRKNAAPTTE